MSYLVLARKWRPKTFQDLTGQTHVIGALTGAFERGHLHHAYLLTGTRGVGKTTIARILAKSFNCETGVTATPCGICSACVQIDGGRFPDMLEIDAASHTGVDNVREILDNAHYIPTMGRHKVYLIDEVHMLSKAAFNAMLKTLEEPPSHVKFILATTDPQKIPPTVLSRCLQFHLRPLQRPQIEARFQYILGEEDITFELPALSLLANAAQGSLRDGLSLLDQAIAYGGGTVKETIVRDMLGIINQNLIFELLDALEQNDGQRLESLLHQLSQETHAFESILDELAQQLHRIALIQQIPSAVQQHPQEAEQLQALAERLSPETVQLFYQIALHGKRDLSLAPDALAGLTMTLLRMLTFRPLSPSGVQINSQSSASSPFPRSSTPPSLKPNLQESKPKASPVQTDTVISQNKEISALEPRITPPSSSHSAPIQNPHEKAQHEPPIESVASPQITISQDTSTEPTPSLSLDWSDAPLPETDTKPPQPKLQHHAISQENTSFPDSNEAWQHLLGSIKASPMVRQLLLQSAWSGFDKDSSTLTLTLTPQHKHLLTFQKELTSALQAKCDRNLKVVVLVHNEEETPDITLDTPAQRIKIAEQEEQSARIQAFSSDAFVQTLCEATGAQVDERSVRPVTSTTSA